MLKLAILRVSDHPDVSDVPEVLFEVDLRSAVKEHVAGRRFAGRSLKHVEAAFSHVEEQLKNLTTTL